jgi:hypothetical protein
VAFVPSVLWAASQRRPASAATASQAQPAAPIIIMPPQPQPVTNNYTYTEIYNDNRRVVAPQPPASARQQLTAQPPPVPYRGRQDGRVFKVVGEMEEWNAE